MVPKEDERICRRDDKSFQATITARSFLIIIAIIILRPFVGYSIEAAQTGRWQTMPCRRERQHGRRERSRCLSLWTSLTRPGPAPCCASAIRRYPISRTKSPPPSQRYIPLPAVRQSLPICLPLRLFLSSLLKILRFQSLWQPHPL